MGAICSTTAPSLASDRPRARKHRLNPPPKLPRPWNAEVIDAPHPIYGRGSPARLVLDIIADKWTPIVLYCLSHGKRRFSELQRQIPDISKKMLTQVLRRLETEGLVHRTVHAGVPVKTDYALTDLGRRIHEPVALLCEWALAHADDIETVVRQRKGVPA